MTTLDQRILIPANPTVVWGYISEITNNAYWQADCKSISFLTTFHKGQGTRFRYATDDDHDYVVEIITWYEGLGYEYTIIDGTPFKSNRGRIRLQEIAEGTIVQWSFSYELGGLLAGMRNSMGVKRGVDNLLIDSLRTLWKRVGQTEHTPKMLMRDAPDVEARAQYRPRHFGAPEGDDQITINPPDGESRFAPPPDYIPSFISEPPIAVDDTRPTVTIHDNGETITQEQLEPDFLASISPFDDLTQKITASAVPAAKTPDTEPKLPAVPTEFTAIPPAAPPTEKTSSQVDTGKISVFELFGLPKPSETQEVRVVGEQLVVTEKDLPIETSPTVEAIPEQTVHAEVVETLPPPQPVIAASAAETITTTEEASTLSSARTGQGHVEAVESAEPPVPVTVFDLDTPPGLLTRPPQEIASQDPFTQLELKQQLLTTGNRVGLRVMQRRTLVRLRRP